MIKKSKSIGSRKVYAIGAAGLILLLVFSFYVPQLIFSLRDIYLCRDFVHEEQENTDVALLGATYEPSLARRMQNFSEGLDRGRSYFVSSQEMEVSQDIYQTLNESDRGFYQLDILMTMMDIGIISASFLNEFTVNQWKQYVIYSDEYTEGVNFIIWYVDLEGPDGRRLELLMDAEDGTLYGVYAERNTVLSADRVKKWTITTEKDLIMYFETAGIALEAWWYYISYYYQILSRDELNKHIDMLRTSVYSVDGEIYQNYGETVTAQSLENAWKGGDAVDSPDSNTLIFHLLFSGQNLDFGIRLFKEAITGSDDSDTDYYIYLYPDVYMGIDPICRMIPEFKERF